MAADTSRFRRIVKVLVIVIVGLVAFVALALLGLQTSPGKRMFSKAIKHGVSAQSDMEVDIEGVTGFVPFNMNIARITLKDTQGVWLSIEDVTLVLQGRPILSGNIHVEQLTAALVSLERLPESSGKPNKNEPVRLPSLPQSLPDVDVDLFQVDRIVFGEAIYPEAASLQAKGQIVTEGAPRTMRANLDLKQLTGPPVQGSVALALTANPPLLNIDAQYNEPEDGPVTNVLGYDAGPTRLGISGEGPLENWDGRLDALAGGNQLLDMTVTSRGAEQPVVQATGRVWVPPAIFEKTDLPLLRNATDISLTAQFVSGEHVHVQQAAVVSALASVQAAGHIYTDAKEIDASYSFTVGDISALVPPKEGQSVSGRVIGNGTIQGPFEQTRITLSANAMGIKSGHARAESISGDFEVIAGKVVKATGRGTLDNAASGALAVEEPLTWTFDTQLEQGGTVVVNSASVEGAGLAANASGSYYPDAKAARLNLTANVAELSDLTQGQVRGTGELTADVNMAVAEGTGTAEISGRVTDLAGLPELPGALLGQTATLTGTVVLNEHVAQLQETAITGERVRLTASGQYQLQEKTIDGNWAFAIADLGPLSPALERPLSGALQLDGDIRGTYPNLAITAAAEGDKLVVDNQPLDIQAAQVNAQGVPQQPAGEARLALGWRGESLEAETKFASERPLLKFDPLRLQAPDTTVSGTLTVNTDTKLVEGKLASNSKDLTWIGSLIGKPLDGAVTAEVVLGETKGVQTARLDASAQSLVSPWLNAETMAVDADVTGVRETLSGSASLEVTNGARGELAVEKLSASIKGTAKEANVNVEGAGTFREPFALNATGNLSESVFTLANLDGRYGEHAIATVQPAKLTMTDGRFALENLALRIGEGRINGSATYSQKDINANLRFSALPLNAVPLSKDRSLTGTAEGSIDVRGTSASLMLDSNIKAQNVELVPNPQRLPQADVVVTASYRPNRLNGSYTIDRLFDAPVTGKVSIPVAVSLSPFSASVLEDESVNGTLNFDGQLDTIGALLQLDTRRISGGIAVAYRLEGTPASPVVQGEATIAEGRFEDLINGVIIQNIAATLRGNGLRLELVEATATDSSKGQLTAEGQLNLSKADNYPFQANVELSKFALVRRDDITASGTGSLSFAGTTKQARLDGDVTVGPAEIYLREPTPQAAVGLDVTEVNKPATEQEQVLPEERPKRVAPTTEKASFRQNLVLAVNLDVPQRVEVRGYGIESEWEGQLQIAGDAQKPKMVGAIELVRGQMTFLGRYFTLTDGTISFLGATPPVPLIDITAEAEAKDVTAVVTISGPAKSPAITLESTPPLPQDEILARILFGRDISSISPIQALQIAQAANELAKGPGALNVLEKTRKALGLEMLNITEVGGEGGAAGTGIEIGTNIGKNVHVNVQQGLGAEGSRAEVRADISENVSVRSSVGAESGTNVELQWKKDY